MRSLSPTSLVALFSMLSLSASHASEAHATDWDYCPGDCPAPEVIAEVTQDKTGACSVEVTMTTPAAMVFQADGGFHEIALTEYDSLPGIYDVEGIETWQILFDFDSEALLVPTNVYDVIDPDDADFDPDYADFGSVVVQSTTLSASPGESGSASSLGFLWADVVAYSDYFTSGDTGPAPSLPTGTLLSSADWFCPFPAWEGSHELSVEVTPNNGDGTCTLDTSLLITGVNDTSADADEFDIMVDSDAGLSFLDADGTYLDLAGGLYTFAESIEVEDGDSGTVTAAFGDLDTTSPTSQLLDTVSWSCDACPELPGDLDLDGIVGVGDLLIILGYYGTDDATADLDGNGVVGSSDLLIILGSFGMVAC